VQNEIIISYWTGRTTALADRYENRRAHVVQHCNIVYRY